MKVVYVTSFGVNQFQLGMMVKGILKDRLDEILDLDSHAFLCSSYNIVMVQSLI